MTKYQKDFRQPVWIWNHDHRQGSCSQIERFPRSNCIHISEPVKTRDNKRIKHHRFVMQLLAFPTLFGCSGISGSAVSGFTFLFLAFAFPFAFPFGVPSAFLFSAAVPRSDFDGTPLKEETNKLLWNSMHLKLGFTRRWKVWTIISASVTLFWMA